MAPPPRSARSWGGWLHDLFEASLVLKAILAAAEAAAGFSLFALPAGQVSALAGWLSRYEIAHDRHEWPVQALERGLAGFSIETQHFYAWYLAAHGLLKLVMVGLLARKVSWAYPASMVVLAGFIAYQIHQWMLTGSMLLLILTAFDVLVIALVWREYRGMRAARAAA
jgi:uncharacterized membrane protein